LSALPTTKTSTSFKYSASNLPRRGFIIPPTT
jgi:hypothetical protein